VLCLTGLAVPEGVYTVRYKTTTATTWTIAATGITANSVNVNGSFVGLLILGYNTNCTAIGGNVSITTF
jgi:hypothetical protein